MHAPAISSRLEIDCSSEGCARDESHPGIWNEGGEVEVWWTGGRECERGGEREKDRIEKGWGGKDATKDGIKKVGGRRGGKGLKLRKGKV